jgi:type III pantothenate kinase
MTSAVLLLDVGNSRVKWALVQASEWLADGVGAHEEVARLLQEWDRFPPPAKVVAANVAGDQRVRALSAYWQSRKVPLTWVKASRECAGVRNLYARPEQLGSDRWAALVGAWDRAQCACLVVSAGTAVTIDALNNQGEFIGGMILPGKQLMQDSLVSAPTP